MSAEIRAPLLLSDLVCLWFAVSRWHLFGFQAEQYDPGRFEMSCRIAAPTQGWYFRVDVILCVFGVCIMIDASGF